MKKIFSTIVLATLSFTLFAQQISDASNLKERSSETAEVDAVIAQAIQNDQEFIDVFNWLMETPVVEQEERRQMVNASISNYIETNPNFDIELDVKLLAFSETSPELLPIFMGGYVAYMIENNSKDKLKANVAGVESVIEYYNKNEMYLEKDKKVEKFIKKAEKDKLENYVERKGNLD